MVVPHFIQNQGKAMEELEALKAQIEELRSRLLSVEAEGGAPDEPAFREEMRRFHARLSDEFEKFDCTFGPKSFPVYFHFNEAMNNSLKHAIQKILWEYDHTCGTEETVTEVTISVSGSVDRAAKHFLHALTPFRVKRYSGPIQVTLE